MPTLAELGWNDGWAAAWAELAASPELEAARAAGPLSPARVAVEHRGAVEVVDEAGAFWAEPTGKMFFAAGDRRALPVVGDWIAVGDAATARASGSRAPLRAILPRRTCLVRRAAGDREEPQPLAANVDVAFVVTSANQELKPRRLERYLTTVRDGGATPVIVLNKIDLVDDPAAMLATIAAVAGESPVVATTATTGGGLGALTPFLGPGRTAVVVGSSGVGKSTIVNALMAGEVALSTQPVSDLGDRGRHTTTRRELFVLADDGGVLIDTPGMRELQLWGDDEDPSASAFDDIAELAAACRFSDCRHREEPDCAVRAAVERGDLAAERLASFHKLAAERAASAARRPRRSR